MKYFRFTKLRTVVATLVPASLLLLAQHHGTADTEESRFKPGPWVSELKVGPKMNAVGKDLRHAEFVGQDLRGAMFDRGDLCDVLFLQCDLSGASFKHANLDGATVDDCVIEGADFTDAIVNGLGPLGGNTYLSEEQLKSTHSYKVKDLSRCTISAYKGEHPKILAKYNFRKAKLDGASLVYGDFSQCDFADASICSINMAGCTIRFETLASTANFKRGSLAFMGFHGVDIAGVARFRGIDFTKTEFFGVGGKALQDADFTDAIVSHAVFDKFITKKQLTVTRSYKEGNLCGMTLTQLDLSGADLVRQNLTGSKFARCDFSGAKFVDAVITDTQFAGVPFGDCTGLTVEQIQSTWNYKNGRMAGVVLPEKIADALRKEKDSGKPK